MEGPAAGAEDFPLNGQTTVAVMVTREVGKQGRRSKTSCCTRCEAVLATLLVLTVATCATAGYMLLNPVTSNPHTCYHLQWKSGGDYEVFTAEKYTNCYIYGWIEFSTERSETVVIKLTDHNRVSRDYGMSIAFKPPLVTFLANVTLVPGYNVSIHLQSKFNTATVCAHNLPTNK